MSARKNTNLYLKIFLFLGGFLLYANTINHQYAWDDKIVIEKNPRVQKGISGIPDLFTKYTSQFQYDKYGYRPVTLISFAVDYTIGQGNPHFSHFMNALYYGLLCMLIFAFLLRLIPGYHSAFHCFVTLLFMVHPLHVEAVANIKSRDEIFALLFAIMSFRFFILSIEKEKITERFLLLTATLATYLLAYTSKENAISSLGIYLLIFWLLKGPRDIQDIKKLISNVWPAIKGILPTILLLVSGFVISILIYKYASTSTIGSESSAGKGIYEESGFLGNSFFFLNGFSIKLANAFNLLLLYIKNFLVPYPLVYYYGYNQIPVVGWGSPLVWISVLLHIGLFVLGIKFCKKRPEILFGLLFYLISIALYLHLLRPFSDTMADRFMFTASLGLCIMLIGIIGLIFKISWKSVVVITKVQKPDVISPMGSLIRSHKIPSAILGMIFLIFSILAIMRNNVWKDDLTLVKHDLPYMENCARAHYYYASLLKLQIMTDKSVANNMVKRKKLEDEMIKHYKRSMEITDFSYLSYLELGTYYCGMLRYNEGLPILQKGVELFPEAADMNFFLGQTYVLTNQPQLSVPYLEKSAKLAYNNPATFYFLSIAYSRTNRYQDALQVANDGMQKFPDDKGTFYEALGFIHFENNQLDKSIEATFQLANYGKTQAQVYGFVVGRCNAAGDTAKANFYIREAKSKGINLQ